MYSCSTVLRPRSFHSQGEYTSGTWEEKSQEINFADFKFSITHHCLKEEEEEEEERRNDEDTGGEGQADKVEEGAY